MNLGLIKMHGILERVRGVVFLAKFSFGFEFLGLRLGGEFVYLQTTLHGRFCGFHAL